MKTKSRHWIGITIGVLGLAGYASAASLDSEKYTYDASGNIVEKTIDKKVTRLSYDKYNRITSKQVEGGSEQTITYDSAGRPDVEKNMKGDVIRSSNYGYSDKILFSKSQTETAEFYYNAEGGLVGKKIAGRVSSYSWDGNALASDGNEVFTNESHPVGGIPIISSGDTIVISDYLGNTLTFNENQFFSTAYGEGLEAGRLTGKPFVKELNAYIFPFRIYSLETSGWITSDPLGFPGGPNRYSYVSGDPVNRCDPLGLYDWIVETIDDNCVFTLQGILGKQTHPNTPTAVSSHTYEVVSGPPCNFAVVDEPIMYTGTSHIELQQIVGAWTDKHSNTAAVTSLTQSEILQHEQWHTKHDDSLGKNSWAKLNDWSENYISNGFASYIDAYAAGETDYANALGEATAIWMTYASLTSSHISSPWNTTTNVLPFAVVVSGVWRDPNADWGQSLNDILMTIPWNPELLDGNCEY